MLYLPPRTPHHASKVALVLIAALLLAILLIWLFPLPAKKQDLSGNDRFGLGFIDGPNHPADEARYQGALATGARWDRWPLYWHWVDEGGYAGIQANEGYDYDALVTQEIEHGLTPVVILMGTPARYATIKADVGATVPTSQSAPPLGATNLISTASTSTLPPDSLAEPIFADGTDETGPNKTINPDNTWANFVFTTVERYRPQGKLARQQGWPAGTGVRYWEVWNEPDYHNFWRGTVAEYYRLLEVAYKSIKAADPEAVVLLGGLAFYDQPAWFAELLNLIGGQPDRAYFDVFSFHHYLSIYDSEQLMKQVLTALEAHNLAGIPLWVTESGVSVWDDFPATVYNVSPNATHRGTMVEQAAYVIQHSALAFYQGVERYYHFMLHDDCGDGPSSAYGLRQNFSPHRCNPAGGQPRPAYAAYQLATEQFRDLVPLWREKQHNLDQVAFYRPGDQSRITVLWATQGVTTTAFLTATADTAHIHWIEPLATFSGTVGLSRTITMTPTQGAYTLTLSPATNQNGSRANSQTYQIGGPPFIVVEKDNQPPVTHFQPLPSTSPPGFLVRWQGHDSGSGIAGYDVYVGIDNEPPRLWLENTLLSEAKYSGESGHSYSFTVQARDRAGNETSQPLRAQVTTRVISGVAVSGQVIAADGVGVANANITILGPNTEEHVFSNDAGIWLPVSLLPGDYTIQAGAAGYKSWSSERRVKVDTIPLTITTTLAPQHNAIIAGDFEGNQVWNVWEWEGQVNLSVESFDGQTAVRLGEGAGQPASCPGGRDGQVWLLGQPIVIPPGTDLVLSFVYHLSAARSPADQAWLEVLLLIDNQPHYLFAPHELQPTSDWAFVIRDVAAWQGQPARLLFRLQNCSQQPFAASLDRISLGPVRSP